MSDLTTVCMLVRENTADVVLNRQLFYKPLIKPHILELYSWHHSSSHNLQWLEEADAVGSFPFILVRNNIKNKQVLFCGFSWFFTLPSCLMKLHKLVWWVNSQYLMSWKSHVMSLNTSLTNMYCSNSKSLVVKSHQWW